MTNEANTTAPATPRAIEAGCITLGGDLRVPRLGFGAMHLTGDGVWGPPRDHAAAREAVIAEALHPYPAGLVIAT